MKPSGPAWAVLLTACLIVGSAKAQAAAPSDDALFRAIDQPGAVQVERLLKQGANPNARDDRGEPALIYALHADRLDAAIALANWPAIDLEAENKQAQTALMVAAYQGHLELVQQLLDRGAEVSHSGWTALHYAASSGQLAVVRLLLENSAYVDAQSPNGTTALMMGARHGDAAVCALLVQEGADPTPRNGAGLSAADFARRAGKSDLADWLETQAVAWRHAHPQVKATPDAASAQP